MNQRPFGRTGLRVSEIGYGAWGIGQSMWLGAEDDESLKALNRAVDLGVTMIDTALERLVGIDARRRRPLHVLGRDLGGDDDRLVALAGHLADEPLAVPVAVGPADYVRECTERSLRHLGLDTIDVQQFHVWSDDWVGRGSWLDGIEALKSEGKIRAFGVSINDHQAANAVKLIESGAVDSVQVIYNVFDQSPEDELLPACEQHGIGVLARVPFDEGALTGTIGPDTEFPDGDFRNHYFRDDRKQQVADHVQAILDDLGIERDQLAEVALRYILSHPAVSTVIPGMRTVRSVERNAAVGDGHGLPADKVAALTRHRWVRDFYR